MVVVVAIIALLSLLSASGFIGARKQYLVDAAAEELLSNIRDTQSRAISVVTDSEGNDTKVWGLGNFDTDNNTYQMLSFYDAGDGTGQLKVKPEDPIFELANPLTISVALPDTLVSPSTGNGLIAFSAPFGKTYLAKNNLAEGGVNGCGWATDSSRIAKDFYLGQAVCNGYYISSSYNNAGTINITLSYPDSNIQKTIIVNSSGDAYIQ